MVIGQRKARQEFLEPMVDLESWKFEVQTFEVLNLFNFQSFGYETSEGYCSIF